MTPVGTVAAVVGLLLTCRAWSGVRFTCRDDFEFDSFAPAGEALAAEGGDEDVGGAGEVESKGDVDDTGAGAGVSDEEEEEVSPPPPPAHGPRQHCAHNYALPQQIVAKTPMLASDDRALEADADADGADPEKLFNMMRVIDTVLTRNHADSLVYQDMTRGKSRQLAAECFFKLLKLKSMDVVELEQEEPFADIVISKNVRCKLCRGVHTMRGRDPC